MEIVKQEESIPRKRHFTADFLEIAFCSALFFFFPSVRILLGELFPIRNILLEERTLNETRDLSLASLDAARPFDTFKLFSTLELS